MAILAVSDSGGYQSIPAQDEDVSPVDRTITSRTQQAFRYLIFVSCAVLVALVGFVVWYQYKERLDVNVYETAMGSWAAMRPVTVKDMASTAFSPTTLSFGNVQCAEGEQEILCTGMPPSPALITFRSSEKYQSLIGFGGAFTEASAVNFYALPQESQQSVLDLYFGQDGNGYTLGRIHINSCDFSLSSYSFDDVDGDTDLRHFDRDVTHDEENLLPFMRAAMARSKRPIRLLASPWSPPAWMKVPNKKGDQKMTGSAVPNGLRDDPQVKFAWARYLSMFISAYASKGVPIWAITPQNEPEFPAPWEACAYTASYENDFIQNYLGPVLREEHPELLILGFDHNKDHLESWAKTLLAPQNRMNIDGMAFHWYSGGDRVEDGTYGYDAVNATHHLAPEGVLLASEGCSCPGVDLGNWLRAERLGHDVMFDLQNYAQGWIDWNLLVDSQGGPNHEKNYCDAALVVNEDFSDVHIQPKFHYMGHFSKFIPPGAVRVGSSAVGNYDFAAIDPNIQAGVEVGMFACERSVRQTWHLASAAATEDATNSEQTKSHASQGLLRLATRALTQDITYDGTVELCLAQSGRLPDRTALRIVDCTDTRAVLLQLTQNSLGQLVDRNTSQCVSFIGDVREPGALLELAPCATIDATDGTGAEVSADSNAGTNNLRAVDHQLFALNTATGELTAPKVDRNLCLTAGWPFFNAVAFTYPEVNPHELTHRLKASVVVMNEAAVPVNMAVWDKERDEYLGLAISPRAIQTIVF